VAGSRAATQGAEIFLDALSTKPPPSYADIPQWKPYTLENVKLWCLMTNQNSRSIRVVPSESFMRVCRLFSVGLFNHVLIK